MNIDDISKVESILFWYVKRSVHVANVETGVENLTWMHLHLMGGARILRHGAGHGGAYPMR